MLCHLFHNRFQRDGGFEMKITVQCECGNDATIQILDGKTF